MLEEVKEALGIKYNFADAELTAYIGEVQDYLRSAGVVAAIVDSPTALGTIARGVQDLRTRGGFTELFYMYASQLAMVHNSWDDVNPSEPTEPTEPTDYNALSNKPTINGVTVIGDKTQEDYNIDKHEDIDDADILDAVNEAFNSIF